MTHAYVCSGEREVGLSRAQTFARALGIPEQDTLALRFNLLSVEDARELTSLAHRAPLTGDKKALIISAERFFHEAQNALLKTFEEPPEGTYLFLIVPNEGQLLPTLRSRLSPLEASRATNENTTIYSSVLEEEHTAKEFLEGTPEAREAFIEKLLVRAKSDREEEKQSARKDARLLAESLARVAYASFKKQETEEVKEYLLDLSVFIPILYERSAPLKPILEHLRITLPKSLSV